MIVWQEGGYQLLKPKNEHRWHSYGKKMSLKAISDLMASEKFSLTYSDVIAATISNYHREREEESRKYFQKMKDIASKTI